MAKLGSEKRPARATVQTMQKAQKVVALCTARGWQVVVGIEPNMPEDMADVERLLDPPAPAVAAGTPGRNEPCSCGSGKKFKKCCGR